MDLAECFQKGLIRKTKIDIGLIKSLKEISDIKERAVKTAIVNEENISAYVSLAYDSLRELLEAITIQSGYKVISNICIGELLRQSLGEIFYKKFDRLRWIRNNINYYGKKVSYSQGKAVIDEIFKMKKELLRGSNI